MKEFTREGTSRNGNPEMDRKELRQEAFEKSASKVNTKLPKMKVLCNALSLRQRPSKESFLVGTGYVVLQGQEVTVIEVVDKDWVKADTPRGIGFLLVANPSTGERYLEEV